MSHESEEEPDEAWGLAKLTPARVTQETYQNDNPKRLCRDNGEDWAAIHDETVQAGLSEAFEIAQAALDFSSLPNSL